MVRRSAVEDRQLGGSGCRDGVKVDGCAVRALDGAQPGGDASLTGRDDLAVAAAVGICGQGRTELNTFYNGATAEEVTTGGRNTIEHIATRGIVARGVLLDVAEVVAERGGPGQPVPITVDDLEAARRSAGVEIRRGDVLHVHSGFVEWYGAQSTGERRRLANVQTMTAAGLASSREMAEYLWDLHIAAVVGDGPSCEVMPFDARPGADPFGFLNRILLGQFGMMIGELWQLGELARDCRQDGRYEFLLVSSPLRLPHGIGSPANALAVK